MKMLGLIVLFVLELAFVAVVGAAVAAVFMVTTARDCSAAEPAPRAVFASPREARNVAICIADAWERLKTPPQMRETDTGYRVTRINPTWGHAALVADVSVEMTGSSTVYLRNKAWGDGRQLRAVEACQ